MRGLGLLFVAALVGSQLKAEDLHLCLGNPARLDDLTLQAFRTELEHIVTSSGRAVSFECAASNLQIAFLREPPEEETSALGGIRVQNGRFIPQIDLFVGPVAQLLPSRLPGILGRALARVAAHELGHWLTRNGDHSSSGVMMERLSAAHLMAPDRRYFRLPQSE